MKLALLAILITAVIAGLIWGGAHLGGSLGNTMIALGVLGIVVVVILCALVYRGLQT